jgi:hypothetical protein
MTVPMDLEIHSDQPSAEIISNESLNKSPSDHNRFSSEEKSFKNSNQNQNN